MKRMLAGVLLVLAMGVGTLSAADGYRRDIRRDETRIAHDRHDLRKDLRHARYGAARFDQRELRRDYRSLREDRHFWYWDHR